MLRKSKQRQAIIRVLQSTSSHPTADWVYEQVRKELPNISFGTVYRNLKLLKDAGEILELDLAAGPSRYNHNVQDHYHFRCNNCGRVFDLNAPVDQDIDNLMAKNTGHTITHHVLEFRGICKDCLK